MFAGCGALELSLYGKYQILAISAISAVLNNSAISNIWGWAHPQMFEMAEMIKTAEMVKFLAVSAVLTISATSAT